MMLTKNVIEYSCIFSKGFPIYSISKNFKELYHYSEKEINFTKFSDLISEEDSEYVENYIFKKVKRGEDFNVIYRIKDKNNKDILVSETGHGIYSKEGIPYAIKGTIEKMDVDIAQGGKKELFEKISEEISQPMLIGVKGGNVKFYNKAFSQLMSEIFDNYSEKDVVENFYHFFEEFDREDLRNRILGQIFKNGIFREDFCFQDINKNKKYIEVKVFQFYDTDSGVDYFPCIINDITQKKEKELLLLEYNKNLEKEVSNKVKELKKVNLELERFVGSVSHDLKSPLSIIVNYVEFINEFYKEDIKPELKDMLNIISDKTFQSIDMINNYLSIYSDMTDNIIKTKFNIDELAQRLISEYRFIYENKNIITQIEEKIEVFTDKKIAESILRNLIENSIKYCKYNEDIKINIGTKMVKGKKYIFIKDNGIGIDKINLKNIFKRYYRINETNANGSGIGLYNVKKFVKKLNGDIFALSDKNIGTSFYINFGEGVTDE